MSLRAPPNYLLLAIVHCGSCHIVVLVYVMCATWEEDVPPRWRYASEDVNSYRWNSAHRHQPKGVGPVRMAHEVFKIALTGCVGMFQGINAREDVQSNNNPIEYS